MVDQNNSCRDALDDRLIFSAFFTNAVPGSELLSANMFIGIILNQIFLDELPGMGLLPDLWAILLRIRVQ